MENEKHENQNFKNYTRSLAFSLALSSAQIKVLARVHKHETLETRYAGGEENIIFVARQEECNTCVRLEKKGLITHNGNEFITTKAGRLVMRLLLISFDEDELYKMRSEFRYTEAEKNGVILEPDITQ